MRGYANSEKDMPSPFSIRFFTVSLPNIGPIRTLEPMTRIISVNVTEFHHALLFVNALRQAHSRL